MVAVTRFHIRPMTEADIAQVSVIEEESFSTTWPRTAYRRELENRLARYIVLVDRSLEAPAPRERRKGFLDMFRRDEPATTTDYIIGYVGMWLMVDEAHVVAIAVREEYRRMGLGELLLAEAVEHAYANRLEVVTLEVRRSNFSAQALYEKYRFLKVGVRKRYYSDNHEDALIMSTPPIQHVSYREHLDYLHQEYFKRYPDRK